MESWTGPKPKQTDRCTLQANRFRLRGCGLGKRAPSAVESRTQRSGKRHMASWHADHHAVNSVTLGIIVYGGLEAGALETVPESIPGRDDLVRALDQPEHCGEDLSTSA